VKIYISIIILEIKRIHKRRVIGVVSHRQLKSSYILQLIAAFLLIVQPSNSVDVIEHWSVRVDQIIKVACATSNSVLPWADVPDFEVLSVHIRLLNLTLVNSRDYTLFNFFLPDFPLCLFYQVVNVFVTLRRLSTIFSFTIIQLFFLLLNGLCLSDSFGSRVLDHERVVKVEHN
jgi:hypothetical protein